MRKHLKTKKGTREIASFSDAFEYGRGGEI
jgi:hypothetical protein